MVTMARNPVWGDTAHTAVTLEVLLDDETEYVPFVASPDDCTGYGPVLYHLAVNGVFGPVSDPPPPTEEELLKAAEQEAEQELNRRLAEINTPVNQAIIQINPGCPQALALQESLSALLAVREQEGWPANVVWPGQNEA